jgi:hypothetical protein
VRFNPDIDKLILERRAERADPLVLPEEPSLF